MKGTEESGKEEARGWSLSVDWLPRVCVSVVFVWARRTRDDGRCEQLEPRQGVRGEVDGGAGATLGPTLTS